MSLIVDPLWSSWTVFLVVALGTLAVVLTGYRQAIAHLPTGVRRTLLGLRLAAWLTLVFLMLRPAVEFTKKDDQPVRLLVVADTSRSMGIADGTAGLTRHAMLLKTLAEAGPELAKFDQQKVGISWLAMGRDAQPVADATELGQTPEGDQSAYGYVLESISKMPSSPRVCRVILLGDGAQRALPPFDVDPRTVASRLADAQIPVDTIVYGGTGLAENAVDLALEDLEVNPTVFVKNTVVVGAKLRALGAVNRDLIVQLTIEDPTGSRPGEPPAMKLAAPAVTLRAGQPQAVLPVELSFVAQDPGEFRLSLKVLPLDGEPIVSNNEVSTYINVLKGGVNVAYFDTVRPEQKFIRLVNESPDIQVDFQPIRVGDLTGVNIIDGQLFVPGKYDVFLIGDVPAKVFGPAHLAALKKAVDAGAGVMMLGGFENFGAGGYADTPLADLLPIELNPADMRTSAGSPDPALHIIEPLKMVPTTAGMSDFVMRLESPDKNLAAWKSLAPLQGANRFREAKALARVLGQAENGLPLLVAQDIGRGRSMAFAADTTYQWVLGGKRDEHQRFWQQVILWLAHKELQGDEATWLQLAQRRLRPGQAQDLTFGARDKDKRPIDDATFQVSIKGPGGETFPVTPQQGSPDFTGKFAETAKPGEYTAEVTALKGGQAIGSPARARFLVADLDLELANPAADLALMSELANTTGGVAVSPEKLPAHLRQLRERGFSQDVEQVTTLPLWDSWPLLGVYVLLLTVEWWLRKRKGLV